MTSGLSSPVGLTHAGDGSWRLFIVEQTGKIRVWDGSLRSAAFLDLSGTVKCCGVEGLLGLAFHPSYESNGFFYVYYTNGAGDNQVVRFTASVPSSSTASSTSAFNILTISHPTHSNHNGGQLAFGPDGYLYIGTGDGI